MKCPASVDGLHLMNFVTQRCSDCGRPAAQIADDVRGRQLQDLERRAPVRWAPRDTAWPPAWLGWEAAR